ncbi:MAG: chemotaxis protein CheX [Planctomycetota bacterium]
MMDACMVKGLDFWLDSAAESVREFAVTCLGMDRSEIRILKKESVPPKDKIGAYLALVSIDDSVQIGVVSSKEGCRSITGAMLAMSEEEIEELTRPDIIDTMGEVVNIIAGMVKSKMVNVNPDLNLGLPVFLDGQVEPLPQQELGTIEIRIKDIDVRVIIIRQRETSSSS